MASRVFDRVTAVHIVACGTSYHAGLVARYWLEGLSGIPCSVEVASEFRYRKHVVNPGTLFVAISQSGETADTLAALRLAATSGYLDTLAICNVPESSLTRESALVFLTKAGAEIGVASTKAFTTQLVALALLVLVLGRRHGLGDESYHTLLSQLRNVPSAVDVVLALDRAIESLAAQLFQRRHALYLGRGTMHPVAMEGALKLKEISYIHAEAYAAGELKHGPLALVDQDMPVIALAPYNELTEKLLSNIEEVRARRGKLYIFADPTTGLAGSPDFEVTVMPSVETFTAPIIYTIPLQLLAYHVALLRGTDVDQPRNLAKSVTVE